MSSDDELEKCFVIKYVANQAHKFAIFLAFSAEPESLHLSAIDASL